jgi:hypothetical protein
MAKAGVKPPLTDIAKLGKKSEETPIVKGKTGFDFRIFSSTDIYKY